MSIARHKIRLVYKSGHIQDFTCSECSAQYAADNKLTKLVLKDAKPQVGYLNLESIAAVLKLKEKTKDGQSRK